MTTTAVRERPILFSAPMVRALLAGTKTQTRRALRVQPSDDWRPYSWGEVHRMRDGEFVMRHDEPVVIGHGPSNEEGVEGYPCPYGVAGDRLWVRETWAMAPASAYWGSVDVDGVVVPHRELKPGIWALYRAGWTRCEPGRWRPSIHMPRAASRIVLEIADVRVQRLQEISEGDALAEGIDVPRSPDGFPLLRLTGINPPSRYVDIAEAAFPDKVVRAYYASLWDDINGPGAWDANPWVWALTFRRVTP